MDDEPLNRMFVELMLEPLGYQLSFAENGRQGVEACAREAFDIVLMDVRMPIMDGNAAVSAIRAREITLGVGRTPIAMFSSNVGPQFESQAALSGADGYIVKPASLEDLLEGMSAACKHAHGFAAAPWARRASGR